MSEPQCDLMIGGRSVRATADFTLRFLERGDAPAHPVLYHRGRRVVEAWSIEMRHEQAADCWGISGGRDDHEFHERSTEARTDGS